VCSLCWLLSPSAHHIGHFWGNLSQSFLLADEPEVEEKRTHSPVSVSHNKPVEIACRVCLRRERIRREEFPPSVHPC
jgi:hypothetical protein